MGILVEGERKRGEEGGREREGEGEGGREGGKRRGRRRDDSSYLIFEPSQFELG